VSAPRRFAIKQAGFPATPVAADGNTELHMSRKLIAVAIVSAALGAGLVHWAKSAVMATGNHDRANVRMSPADFARSAGRLPVELFDGLQ
jgi:hypothetical protein